MGLDMYLSKRTYVQNWEHMMPERKNEITVKTGGKVNKSIKADRISYIEEEVAYWRKANAIHAWFVLNVQDGEDDCESYWVPTTKIQKLIDLCSKVLETRDGSLLPPAQGFFFGSQNVDEWYFEMLEDTVKTLSEDLKHHKETGSSGDYYYRSSW